MTNSFIKISFHTDILPILFDFSIKRLSKLDIVLGSIDTRNIVNHIMNSIDLLANKSNYLNRSINQNKVYEFIMPTL